MSRCQLHLDSAIVYAQLLRDSLALAHSAACGPVENTVLADRLQEAVHLKLQIENLINFLGKRK